MTTLTNHDVVNIGWLRCATNQCPLFLDWQPRIFLKCIPLKAEGSCRGFHFKLPLVAVETTRIWYVRPIKVPFPDVLEH
jgi:hypothetical protein